MTLTLFVMVRCMRSDEGAQRASNHDTEKYLQALLGQDVLSYYYP